MLPPAETTRSEAAIRLWASTAPLGHDHRREVQRPDVLALGLGARQDHRLDVVAVAEVVEHPREQRV